MFEQSQAMLAASAHLDGDAGALLSQLGLPDETFSLRTVANAWQIPPVTTFEGLSQFLERYHAEVLVPVELPSIFRAYELTRRNQIRELIQLDQCLSQQIPAGNMASASRRVGLNRLRRLRPLRDFRPVQRYLEAIESGKAQGWHTLIYGMTLAIYSLPLRQGLINYSRQTLAGFVNAAERNLSLEAQPCQELLDFQLANIPVAVETTLSTGASLIYVT